MSTEEQEPQISEEPQIAQEPQPQTGSAPSPEEYEPRIEWPLARVAKPEPQIAQLLARIEALEQERSGSKPAPFWKNTAAVGMVGGLIAIVPASLTAIHEYYQTEREVLLNTTKYQHERTVSYLDRALNPDTTEIKQAQVLRFLRHLPEKDPIREWAEEELGRVEEDIEELKKETQEAEKTLESLETKKVVLEAETEQILEAAENKGVEEVEPLLQAKQSELDDTRRKIKKVEQKAAAAARRVGELPPMEPELSAPSFVGSVGRNWRIRIAARQKEGEIKLLAAQVSGKGETPQIYSKGPMFYLFVGRYQTREQAEEHVGRMRGLLGEGAWARDVSTFCKSPNKKPGYIECGE